MLNNNQLYIPAHLFMTDSNRKRRSSEPTYMEAFKPIQHVSANSFAVDFVGKNLFWSEKRSINIANLKGLYRKTLITRHDESTEIIGMTIDPMNG